MSKRTRILILSFLFPLSVFAQSGGGDFFSNIGKIYVVVAVIVVMFLILAFFLIYLDRKISKLEKQISNE